MIFVCRCVCVCKAKIGCVRVRANNWSKTQICCPKMAAASAPASAPTLAPVSALARASAYLKQNAKELKCEPYNGKQKIILALTSRAALVTTQFLCTQHNTAHTLTQHTNTHVYLQAAGWLLLLLLKRWSNEKKCQLVQRETATAVAAAAAAIAGTATAAAAAGSTAAQPALEVWAQQKAATTTATTTKHVSNARHSEEY